MTIGDKAIAFGFMALWFVIGILCGADFTEWSMQREAVEHGCASYDPQTGKWGWK